MTGHEEEPTVPSARASTNAAKAQLARALEPSIASMLKQVDEALQPSKVAMLKQVDEALQPSKVAMLKQVDEALQPSKVAMLKQIDEALQPSKVAMLKQIDEALQPSKVAMLKQIVAALEPSMAGLNAQLAEAMGSSDRQAAWDADSTRSVARLLDEIQDPALVSISESSARLAKEMIADGTHARLLNLSEVDEQSKGDSSTSTAIDGQSQEDDDRGSLLGMSPEQYFAATITTVLALLWLYVYLTDMIRLGQGVANLNRASLIMELYGLAAAVKDVYGRSLEAGRHVQGIGSDDGKTTDEGLS